MTTGKVIGGDQSTTATRLSTAVSRLPSLTGLRFPAALLVFFNHIGQPFPELRLLKDNGTALDWFQVTKNAGALGVSFFFVLSGFVLTWSIRDKDTTRAFLRRRFFKIYPNYVVTWALAMALFAAAYTPVRAALANLFLIHAWIPRLDVFTSVDAPSWSLACEAIFYASFPLLLFGFRRIRLDRLKYWIAAMIVLVIVTPWVAYTVLSGTPNFPGGAALGAKASVVQYWFAYYLPPLRMTDFALGMLIAIAVRNGRWWNIGLVWSSVLLVGSYVLASYVPFLYSQRSVTIIPIAFLIAAAASADAADRCTLFRNRAMVWLGEISFAFYLIHWIVLAYTRKVLGSTYFSTPATVGIVLVQFTVALLLSWALHVLVERPIYRRWSSARARKPSDRSPSSHSSEREVAGP